ncbi:MAG: hypothetical protein ACI4NJ_08850 [Cellvibrio sp.]
MMTLKEIPATEESTTTDTPTLPSINVKTLLEQASLPVQKALLDDELYTKFVQLQAWRVH